MEQTYKKVINKIRIIDSINYYILDQLAGYILTPILLNAGFDKTTIMIILLLVI